MSYLTAEFWEVVLDVIGLCLCGITILYLIRNKTRFNQSVLKDGSEKNISKFDEALIIQLLKQQSERSFETIFNTIKKERSVLQKLIEEGKIEKTKKAKDLDEGEPASDQYREVARMADLGVSMKEISERVNLPRSEVDLIINLKSL
ncbi:MAG: DUF2802 domain-containing protein [Deltaproteobacteria bacterium]|nr:DUF2802 domain-containing protein [Deltaproteobacteria bacterium]MBW1736398.1 DUF2802 domain-containing protein [Deltaproteobacteria bacterium]MBW1908137.1 DUF2802 domain-containing protein [Deltaproteobacteria bacterium]MBW2032216.1 DUF2802 domain-containing protein [Deltaproteobacteria bacterium]MBW2113789.1 DUF2802 domain-containing protein [Deltaproteobacteria bacterium]